jgi:hypothetical protein
MERENRVKGRTCTKWTGSVYKDEHCGGETVLYTDSQYFQGDNNLFRPSRHYLVTEQYHDAEYNSDIHLKVHAW